MILLTIQESEKQVVSGIPEKVSVISSVPATIFYTLDGSDPNEDSEIYVDSIYLTYNSTVVTLKLFAQGATEQSSVIEFKWSVAIPDYDKVALTKKEGVNVRPVGKPIVDSLAVDLDGNLAKTTAIPFEDLDIKTSTSDRIGQEIPDNSTVPFIKFPKFTRPGTTDVSNPEDINFDPTAKVIVINGYAGLDKQQIRIINRPNGTMGPTSKYMDEKFQYNSMISGDFVRYMYNPVTKKLVFYYRESLDGRWIISSQKVDAATFNFTPIGNPFVFRWIEDRCQTRIF